ncbi:MAG: ammonium transporter, Amt family [Solirubrobacteraceae bacterium]|nr:ammonium transporter, Amt family [Solirubrobacteraceae bacterium]
MSLPLVAASTVDTGDTAWMLVATALVLLMTPALGLFYAGLVRSKNTLNTFMMCVGAIAIATVTWALVGYSIAFDGDAPINGGLHHALLNNVGFEPRAGTTIPQLVFFAFQATFCIITTALVSGAVVERMRFGPFLVFSALWSVLVYAVLAHWAFGGGWLAAQGTLDFAGGVPVEMGSGFSALAAALVVGARRDYGRQALLPHNAMYVLLGAGLLWFGWFGFNGGSGFSTGNPSVLAFTNTLLTPACTLAVWFILDAIRGRTVTAIGAATAIIVGCVGITPAGGFVSPAWAMVLGALVAIPSYFIIVWRTRTRIDETLDVLAAHGIAGFFGIVFIGFFAQMSWNGTADGLFFGDAGQLGSQLVAAAAAPVYAFGATYGLLRLIGAVMPLRGSDHQEAVGMDIVHHGEEAYASGEGALLIRPEIGTEEFVRIAEQV